ncbi:MAG: hypothetical protein IJ373_07715 [Clostridia bacterium]|nr:hypothetical protein [Clostridia bacterium]
MLEVSKIIGVAFITTFASILLKQTKPELSFAVIITGVLVILLFIVDALQNTLSAFSSITAVTGIENGLLKVLIKIVGVGYLTEFGASVLQDFGSNSLSDKVTLGGKITIVLLSLPVVEGLLNMVKGFLQLV